MPTPFDCIIVYAQGDAQPSTHHRKTRMPFSASQGGVRYNRTYAYMLDAFRQAGLRVAFAWSHNICGPGQLEGYWTHDDNGWHRHADIAQTRFVFNRFPIVHSTDHALYQTLTSDARIRTFKSPKLIHLFRDKLSTYQRFPQYSIPTVAVEQLTPASLRVARQQLELMMPRRTPLTELFVLKNRFGIGGAQTYLLDMRDPTWERMLTAEVDHAYHYILQPFIECHTGFQFGAHKGRIDVRVVVFRGQPIDSYIRIAKKGEFRANASQGGAVAHISLAEIPQEAMNVVRSISVELTEDAVFYALDFLRSNAGELYLIEGNDSPGLIWFNRTDEVRTKQVIDMLVKDMKQKITTRTIL